MHRTKTSFLAFFAIAAFHIANLSWADEQPSRVIDSDSQNQRLNIVFILVDDLGKEWIQCYGGEDIQTPHIDDLAATGMKFTNAYSMPQCTPSRACFLTGQYPFRNGWVNHWDVPRWGVGYFDWKLNPCIANELKAAGYQTAIAGKWQINDFRVHPNCLVEMGFDEFCMWTGCETDPHNRDHERRSTRRYWDPYIHTKQGSRTYNGQFGPDVYNQFVLDFIAKNRDKPFFVYYPMALTHGANPYAAGTHALGTHRHDTHRQAQSDGAIHRPPARKAHRPPKHSRYSRTNVDHLDDRQRHSTWH